ncbi:hypothetical protein HGRIS_005641 [Hohenbuehelia grisea]|uniref:ribonuclease Z n=1 Tax=Hohenbuehelia grisea TaxID=104357 RepID=A0ABR3JYC5_9AGAR
MFFTSVGTQRASGLAGLLMTLADATIPKLELVGPPGLTHFVAAMRSYTYRDTMPLTINECPSKLSNAPTPVYKDNNITVYSLPIHASSSPDLSIGQSAQLTKRKRELSPDAPSKRTAGNDRAPGAMPEAHEIPPSLLGERSAEEYRDLLISTMFPGSKAAASQNQPANKQNKKTLKPDGSLPSSSTDSANVDIYKRARLPSGFHRQLPRWNPPYEAPNESNVAGSAHSKPAFAYVLVGPRVRGKFDVKRAEALGVPFGRLRGLLTKGQAVTFPVKVGDETIERTVRPEECVGESESPGVILIVDAPTKAHIPSLNSAFEDSGFFAKFRSRRPEDLKEYLVRTVFHLCGDDVLDDPAYQTFMSGFDSSTHHVVASRQHCPDPVTFTSVAFNQLRLNQLDAAMFPLPKFNLTPPREFPVIPGIEADRIMPMTANILVKMRPFSPPSPEVFDNDDKRDLFHSAVVSSTPHSLPPLTKTRFTEAQAAIQAHSTQALGREQNGKDVKLIPLGTGSALPSKYRNVSSTLIQIPNWGNILLDAGEGTWGQLSRQFGTDDQDPNNVWAFLRDLRCIYISHVHGDHHMGVAKILAQRKKLDPPPEKPLYLVAIRAAHLYLREISDIEDLGICDLASQSEDGSPSPPGRVVTVMSEALHWKRPDTYPSAGMWQLGGNEPWTDINRSKRAAQRMCDDLGLRSFQTVDVFHRTRCYGAVIKHQDGWSIVFSGDTQPTDTLVWAGKGATLLIHEATMADDQVEMARRKAHSTFGQAIDIGKRMNAQNILLTHFSARYPKMPPNILGPKDSNDTQNASFDKPIIALAFDHANITIGDMWKLNHYTAAMEQCFRDSMEEGDEEGDPTTALGGVEVDIS